MRKERTVAGNNLSGWLMAVFCVFLGNNVEFPHRICPIVGKKKSVLAVLADDDDDGGGEKTGNKTLGA